MTPKNARTGREYKGGNAGLLDGHEQWATFIQWSQLGFMVIKGQHGVKILAVGEDDKGDHWIKRSTVFHRGQVEAMETDKHQQLVQKHWPDQADELADIIKTLQEVQRHE